MDTHSETTFPCPKCENVFKTRSAQLLHIRIKHEQESRHVCFCGKRYDRRSSLKYHQESHLSTPIERKCPHCMKTFLNKTTLNNLIGHTHAKKQPCEVCGKMVGPGTFYKQHLKLHESVVCTFPGCKLEFVNHLKLRIHVANEHENKKTPCPTCEKVFDS